MPSDPTELCNFVNQFRILVRITEFLSILLTQQLRGSLRPRESGISPSISVQSGELSKLEG